MLLLLLQGRLEDGCDVAATVVVAAAVVNAEDEVGLAAVAAAAVDGHGQVVVLFGWAVVADACLSGDDDFTGGRFVVVVGKRVVAVVAVMLRCHHL